MPDGVLHLWHPEKKVNLLTPHISRLSRKMNNRFLGKNNRFRKHVANFKIYTPLRASQIYGLYLKFVNLSRSIRYL